MTWRVNLLNRPELPDSLSGDLTYEVARQVVDIIESGRFDEQELEEALLLVPGLIDSAYINRPWRIIGRQLPVPDSGKLDLLVAEDDSYDELQVIELKAAEIRRGDLAQVRDYVLALEEMSSDDLAWHITTHAGRQGVPRIWDPTKLRSSLWDKKNYPEDSSKIKGVVIGTSYRPNIHRLARDLGIELRTVTELCSSWEFSNFVDKWRQKEEDADDAG